MTDHRKHMSDEARDENPGAGEQAGEGIGGNDSAAVNLHRDAALPIGHTRQPGRAIRTGMAQSGRH